MDFYIYITNHFNYSLVHLFFYFSEFNFIHFLYLSKFLIINSKPQLKNGGLPVLPSKWHWHLRARLRRGLSSALTSGEDVFPLPVASCVVRFLIPGFKTTCNRRIKPSSNPALTGTVVWQCCCRLHQSRRKSSSCCRKSLGNRRHHSWQRSPQQLDSVLTSIRYLVVCLGSLWLLLVIQI